MVQIRIKIYGETLDFQFPGRVLKANLLQKLFSDREFYVTITDADIVKCKFLHTLFEQIRTVLNIQKF